MWSPGSVARQAARGCKLWQLDELDFGCGKSWHALDLHVTALDLPPVVLSEERRAAAWHEASWRMSATEGAAALGAFRAACPGRVRGVRFRAGSLMAHPGEQPAVGFRAAIAARSCPALAIPGAWPFLSIPIGN